jgi:hypothetical protein
MSSRLFSARHLRAIALASVALLFAPIAGADPAETGEPLPKDELASASADAQYPAVPKSAVQVELEIRRVAQKIDDLERRVTFAEYRKAEFADQLAELQQAEKAAAPIPAPLKALLNELSAVDCKSPIPEQKVQELRRLVDAVNELSELDGVSRSTVRLPDAAPGPKQCALLKAFALESQSLPHDVDKLTRELQKEVKRIGRTQAQNADDARQLAGLKQWLDRLRDKSEAGSSDVIDKLPVLIAFLGIFSLSIMVMVRRFTPEIQREWVQSGQVIQFMTVTVIVIAVLSLGLAQMLSRENLGTLLGTIGGYVLAQGIGRSAARKDPQDKPAGGRLAPPGVPATTPPLGGATVLPNAE